MLNIVSTPIGNLYDISFRAVRALESAQIVLCEDTRVAKKLYSLLKQKNLLNSDVNSKSFIPFHSHNQAQFLDSLTQDFFDKEVVFISDAGMPCISDPGALLVNFALNHNIPFDTLPGACAANVAYCNSGSLSTGFFFAGFLPHKKTQRIEKILNLTNSSYTQSHAIICYESSHRILECLSDFADILPDVNLSVQKELTKLHQKLYRGCAEAILNELKNANINGEWVIIWESKSNNKKLLDSSEIINMDLPPKIKAKILSKMLKIESEKCYQALISNQIWQLISQLKG